MVIFGNKKYQFIEQRASIFSPCFIGGVMVFFLEKRVEIRSVVDPDFLHNRCRRAAGIK